MEKMVVVVFNGESKAYEGSRALEHLDFENSIALSTVTGNLRAYPGDQGSAEPTCFAVLALSGSLDQKTITDHVRMLGRNRDDWQPHRIDRRTRVRGRRRATA